MRKILILAVNPKDTSRLRLDEEVRDIKEGIKRSQKRDQIIPIPEWAVRTRDLRRLVLEHKPQIVHFSGHGEGQGGLCFEDNNGRSKQVTGSSLKGLFRLLTSRTNLECVILNGCYSYPQAQAIAECVPYVIGMQGAVSDRLAIEFAVGFYDALGNGESIEFAFECGKTAMKLDGAASEDLPILMNQNAKVKARSPQEESALEPVAITDRATHPEHEILKLGNGVSLELVYVCSGDLSRLCEKEASVKQHYITVPSFWMSKYPITQAQYKAVTSQIPSEFEGSALPVECVSWNDSLSFCKKVSEQENGWNLRLPSEAEWEYACRSGTTTAYSFGDRLTKKYANFAFSINRTSTVGTYPTNNYGLSDMHGNVREWCQDTWDENYENPPNNGSARLGGDMHKRVLRGGSWVDSAWYCRSAYRSAYEISERCHSVGFRVVGMPVKK